MGDDASNIGVVGVFFLIIMGALFLVLPRRLAVLPLFMAGCYMTIGQVINLAGLHFYIIRIMIVFGWARLVLRKELHRISGNAIDYAIVLWVVSGCTMYVLRLQSWEAFVNRLGFAYNMLGGYFLFRLLVRDLDEVMQSVKILAVVTVPLALVMLIEGATGRNMFSTFGGVPDITAVRDGRLRCQGPFRHPILAGTFGATSMPLFIPLWLKGKRLVAVSALMSAMLITYLSASSGPLISLVCVILGFAMWPYRRHIRLAWWGALMLVVSLHLVMKAPVWYLIARAGESVGGGGFHRSAIIDAAIKHFDEWWFWGTDYTAHWMDYALSNDPSRADITNQYIWEGVNGGLISMLLFITVVVLCFRNLGRAVMVSEERDRMTALIVWSVGVSFLSHAAAFLSVSYFDQMVIFWLFILAAIAVISDSPGVAHPVVPGATDQHNQA